MMAYFEPPIQSSKTMLIQISSPEATHKSDFLRLWQGYLDFYESDLPGAKTELTWTRLMSDREPVYARCAFGEAQQMLGFVTYVLHRSTWAEHHYCYLEDLFVAPSARGLGVGRALIEDVCGQARKRKCERLYWATQATNTEAQALYDKLAAKTDFLQYRMQL